MKRPIWGIILFAFGLMVVADGWLGFVQKNVGVLRWIYTGLGAVLVVRGLYVWRPFRKQNED